LALVLPVLEAVEEGMESAGESIETAEKQKLAPERWSEFVRDRSGIRDQEHARFV
jgi:hypothetical protein